jgi:hypothetical protein
VFARNVVAIVKKCNQKCLDSNKRVKKLKEVTETGVKDKTDQSEE